MSNYTTSFLLAVTLFSGIAFNATAQNNVPLPDSSFNGIGHLLIEDYPQLYPSQVALQSDGKVIILGEGNLLVPGPNLHGYICRVNTDGTLDTSFADGGFYAIPFGLNNINKMYILPDDKILIQFGSLPTIYFVRLNNDGTLDTSFGSDGVAIHSSTSDYEKVSDMVVQPDQKILSISYHLSNYKISVRRFYPDGILDETYGDQGVFHLDTFPFILNPIGHLQSDGKLVITGITGGPYQLAGFVAVRLNENGGLDNTFSDDGIYIKIIGSQYTDVHAFTLTINADGIIYIGGSAPLGNNKAATIMSLNPDGTPNLNFGPNGVRHIFFGYFTEARKLLLQSDGKILIAGRTKPNNNTEKFLLARFNTNGILDAGFGNNGTLELTPYSADYKFRWLTDALFAPDGKLYCVGHLHETSNYWDNAQNSQILYRFLLDEEVNTKEPNPVVQYAKAIPSLVTNDLSVLLEYELRLDANIHITLFDQNGTVLRRLLPSCFRTEGNHSEKIALPEDLNPGTYYIVLSDGKSHRPVKLMKL
jgi:uncharacterized delta-60 repeat protein